ncbi:hypothetical protein [Paracoccus yeei]|uniref:hypothetical protein n=1 Tax=Paracoccus yeei TaxID=147645 RepID=UPI0012FD6FCF|nr:hypothetical protein [Paracoccus yeei]
MTSRSTRPEDARIPRTASAKFSTPVAKKMIKVVQELGLPVTACEVLANGTFRLETTSEKQRDADAALDAWIRSQGG